MEAAKIKLRFGKARNGWLPVELAAGETTLDFCASYLPNDFVADLIAVLLEVLATEGTFVARLYEEPVESDWMFYRVQEAVVFSILQYPGPERHRGKREKLIQCSGTIPEIVVPFWRGLQELGSRQLKESYKRNWSVPFPSEALALLSERVRQVS